MQFIRGQKVKISDIISNMQLTISSSIAFHSKLDIDMVCFGVDDQDKISDDHYFIFYNQKKSPDGSIQKIPEEQGEIGRFFIDFSILPMTIKKVVVAVVIDGSLSMKDMQYGNFKLFNSNKEIGQFSFEGQEFKEEKALILAEFYEKDTIWRINFIGRGFNGGLSSLLKHYGGEESKEQVGPAAQPKKISLSKEEAVNKLVLEKAPHLVDLTKKAVISLKKKQLVDTIACVALVMDRSRSMHKQYREGDVQKVFDRVLPLALMFDDNKELDVWAFAESFQRLSSIRVDNIKDYVEKEKGGWKKWDVGWRNDEIPVIKDIIKKYKKNVMPVYVIFISDGGIRESAQIKKIITEAAAYPIFWQFVGLGGKNYGILEKLDTLENRIVDNANFFSLDAIDKITDEELYNKLLNEFPLWIKEAKTKAII